MREVPLTRGEVALVDDEDFDRVAAHLWQAIRRSDRLWHAQRIVGSRRLRRTIMMHREIIGALPGQEVDHINCNGLDNRRENLRICTRQQNNANMRPRPGSSKFKGVCFSKNHKRWKASIKVNGRHIHLGYFTDEIAAASAYDAAALEHFGAFARINFPAPLDAGSNHVAEPQHSALLTMEN